MEGRWNPLYESLGYCPPAGAKAPPPANEAEAPAKRRADPVPLADTDLPLLGPEELEALKAAFLRIRRTCFAGRRAAWARGSR